MVASRQVESPFYKCNDQQRGRGFRALAQGFGGTADPFLHEYIVQAAIRVGADFLEFAAAENAEVVSRRNFNTAAKCVGRHTLRK